MSKAPKRPSRDLSIYLLNEEVDPDAVVAGVAGKPFAVQVGNTPGRLYVSADPPHPPRWLSLFADQLSAADIGSVGSVSAVLVVMVAGRHFALTFGRGRFLLRPDVWAQRFGLVAGLNLIDPVTIQSVDKQTLDSLGKHSRIQAAHGARILEFGIDIDRDLLHAVTGRPRKEVHGLRVTGRDALRVTAHAELKDIPQLLTAYLTASQSTGHRNEYPWLDQVAEIRDSSVIRSLDTTLSDRVADDATDGVALAVPGIVDWNEISTFRYQGVGDTLEHTDLVLADVKQLLAEDARTWTPESMRSVRVMTIDPDGVSRARWSLYECIHAEIDKGGKSYVISAGRWYQVNRGLVEEVNASFSQMKSLTPALATYQDKSEAAYCERVAEDGKTWALLDRKPIRYGGGRSQVEFCDLFNGPDRTLLHVKRYAGSSPLSHLFAQALVSGESFKLESDFRKVLNGRLPKPHRLLDPKKAPEAFKVGLGIVKAGSLDLPFFSKVTLRHAVKRLTAYGFEVLMAHIAIDPQFALLKKAPKKKPKSKG